jgi:hypothetical protein
MAKFLVVTGVSPLAILYNYALTVSTDFWHMYASYVRFIRLLSALALGVSILSESGEETCRSAMPIDYESGGREFESLRARPKGFEPRKALSFD